MSSEREWLIEVTDYEGVSVYLALETWTIKLLEHPEIRGYLPDVGVTVQSPDLVFASTRDPRARIFYRLYVGREEWKGKHLIVVVKYVQ